MGVVGVVGEGVDLGVGGGCGGGGGVVGVVGV